MIPKTEDDLLRLEVEVQPSLTYNLDIEHSRTRGMTDNLEALKQAIYLILNTERYAWVIYSPNYGVELCELIGQPKEYVLSELKRRISEALLQDDRITEVTDWAFSETRDTVTASFTVKTIFGDISVVKEVRA